MTWLNIGRTGKFTAMKGQKVEFTAERFDRIAGAYDPKKKKAPLVFGHPSLNAPAFGWVTQLRRLGDFLQAKFEKVPEAVKKAVDDGHYKYFSMALDGDKLRHVGLLGAVPPAIDGLGDAAFSEGGELLTIEFSENPETEESNVDELEKARAEIAALKTERDRLATEKAASDSALETEKTEFAAYRQKQEVKERKARAEALVKDGKLLPGEVDQVVSLAKALSGSEEKVEFASADGTKTELSAEDAHWKQYEDRKPHSLFEEFASPVKANPGGDEPELDTKDINDFA